jgi:hypothetical protein
VKQLSRFLRLERARKDAEPDAPARPRRFDTLEEAPAASGPGTGKGTRPVVPLERFAPEPEAPLALQPPDDEQPFVRCPSCCVDAVRHAVLCRQCEARLDTDEVRAFNARLWEETRAAREREAEASAGRQRELLAEATAIAAAKRRLAEDLASDVGQRERARLALEGPWPQAGAGWALLRALPELWMRAVVLALAVGIPGLLLVLARRGSAGFWLGVAGAVTAVVLFGPCGRR